MPISQIIRNINKYHQKYPNFSTNSIKDFFKNILSILFHFARGCHIADPGICC